MNPVATTDNPPVEYRGFFIVEAANPTGGRWLVSKAGQLLTRCFSTIEARHWIDVFLQPHGMACPVCGKL